MKPDVLASLNAMVASGEHSRELSKPENAVLQYTAANRAVYLTEEDALRRDIISFATVRLADRDITLPGLGDRAVQDLGVAVVAKAKQSWKRNYKPYWMASDEDMTVLPLSNPKIFGYNNWQQTGLSANTSQDILPNVSGTYSVDDTNERMFLTDFVEYHATPVITAIEITVDGGIVHIHETRQAFKLSQLQVFKMPSPELAKVSIDVDARSELAGDTELTPMGLYVCTGESVPALV